MTRAELQTQVREMLMEALLPSCDKLIQALPDEALNDPNAGDFILSTFRSISDAMAQQSKDVTVTLAEAVKKHYKG